VKWNSIALVGILLASGCKKDIQNEAAVKAGIVKYIATRTNLSEMDVSVTAVSFRENDADATVHFQAKGNSNPGAGLEMKYSLERKGSEWVVKGRSGSGVGHAMGSAMPSPSGLPAGHPHIPMSPPAGDTK
jgi:hypothetical protein